MTSLTSVVYLTCLFLWGKITSAQKTHQSSSIHQESGFKSVNVGESIILQCFYGNDVSARFYWYKQTLGQKPKLISTFYIKDDDGIFYDEYNNSRFSLQTKNGKNHLLISDLRISDSATYYCACRISVVFEFAEGVTVSVKGSDLNIKASVHQSSSETVQPGGSVTLNCTVQTGSCDEGHSVYWFKDSEDSHPGLIYTHGDKNDQCKRKNNAQTHTCVYNLPMENLNLSHNGIYYCAVASCGHILFGNGTKLKFKREVSVFLVYFLGGAFAFTTILALLLAALLYTYKRNSQQATESHAGFSASYTMNSERCQAEENLHYAALRVKKANRSRSQTDDTMTTCIYSGVK